MYCVNENLNANPRFAFYFQIFLLSLLYNTYGHFSSKFSQDYEIFVNFVISLKELKSLMATAGGM